MAGGVDFKVEAIDALHIEAPPAVRGRNLLSPFVWKEDDGFAMLVRVVESDVARAGNTGSIHYATSNDGLSFTVRGTPTLAPGPDATDIGGCEDPTVVKWQGRYIVYYTGVDADLSTGRMLYASGPGIDRLTKTGVAHRSTKSEGNTKEATIERTADGRWRLFYEYARDGASLVGLAFGADVNGPWHEQPAPFAPRPDRWDNWHLSPGPLLTDDPDMPVMFYNGATHDARWRIGWIAFNRDCTKVVRRCVEPLIVPPPPNDRTATDIAFAASVIVRDGRAHLYYSLEDRELYRAIIRPQR